jgi:hypothetical protein
MAQTSAEYLDSLLEERDVLQAKLKAIADNATFSTAGAAPNANGGPLNVDHGEFYERWQRRLKTINEEIAELQDGEAYLRESRGVA